VTRYYVSINYEKNKKMGLESIFSMLGGQSGGAMSAINGAFNSGMTNAANMKMAKYQYSQEMDMWNKANAYNAPSAQMDRLKQAGLNPNLIYGNGSAATGQTANQLPRYQAPTMRADVMPEGNNQQNYMNNYQDYKIKAAQVDNLEAQRLNTQAETLIKALQAKSIAAGNYYNFGNQDYKNVVDPSADWNGNYSAKNSLLRYQASVAGQTVDDMINKIRLSNISTGAQIPLTNARTQGQSLMNQYQGSINKFASSSQIANIISKVLPLLLRR
jgi:hypothetical protein